MAGYRGHLAVSSILGGLYGTVDVIYRGADWGEALLAVGLTTIGGLLPDLDSDSGVPVRELFGAAACIVPCIIYRRITGLTEEQLLVVLAAVYVFIRYILSGIFKRFSVHRGMFHSIPAMFISGLVIYLGYHSPSHYLRVYLGCGVMLGFLSHLVLDEIYSVDFNGVTVKFNKFAGSALKLASPSWLATSVCYAILAALLFVAWRELYGSEWPK